MQPEQQAHVEEAGPNSQDQALAALVLETLVLVSMVLVSMVLDTLVLVTLVVGIQVVIMLAEATMVLLVVHFPLLLTTIPFQQQLVPLKPHRCQVLHQDFC